jgi:hypothetical protein
MLGEEFFLAVDVAGKLMFMARDGQFDRGQRARGTLVGLRFGVGKAPRSQLGLGKTYLVIRTFSWFDAVRC